MLSGCDSIAEDSIAFQLKNPNRKIAVKVLEKITTNEIPVLLELAADRAGTTESYQISDSNYFALAGFQKLNTNAASAIPALAKLLEKEETTITAGMCLAQIGNDSIPVLTNGLTHTNWHVRHSTATALGHMETKAKNAVPSLLAALNDEHRTVRCSAAEALGKIKQEPDIVIPALIKLLDDSETTVRWNAALALGEFGGLSSNAVPKLKQIAEANIPYLSERALTALNKIDSKTAKNISK